MSKQTDDLTPSDVRKMRPGPENNTTNNADMAASTFARLLAPRAKVAIYDTLLANGNEPLTVSQMVEQADTLSRTTWDRHKDVLLEAGVIVERGRVGNAMTYKINDNHPVGQLLIMIETVSSHGVTPDLLSEQFKRTPGEEADRPDG